MGLWMVKQSVEFLFEESFIQGECVEGLVLSLSYA